MPDNVVVLTPEQLQQLRDLKAQVPGIKRAISDARRAGIDITGLDAQLTESINKLNALLAVYDSKSG